MIGLLAARSLINRGNQNIDPYWGNVVSLLPFSEISGATQTADVAKAKWSANGAASISTTQKKFGSSSLKTTGGSADYISSDFPAIAFGTSDFTIEFFIYLNSTISTQCNFVEINNGGNPAGRLTLYCVNSTTIRFYSNAADRIISSISLPLTTWTHVALCRTGGVTKLYVGGALAGSWTNTQNHDQTAIKIGGDGVSGSSLPGYIDEFRITRGTARYTAAFTPPTSAFPDNSAGDASFSQVTALLHMENSFIDQRSVVWAASGNAQIDTSQSRFGGASLKCDGSGDWFSTSGGDFYLSGDFTIECWAWTNIAGGSTVDIPLWAQYADVNSDNNRIHFNANRNTLTFYVQTTTAGWIQVSDATYAMPANRWVHLAVSRSGNVYRVFADGQLRASATQTNAMPRIKGPAYIGFARQASGLRSLNGYIDEVRVTNGIARYTGNFTPPNAPFPTG